VTAKRLFPSKAEMVAALAAEIADDLAAGVAQRGGASLVATGGSTPGPLYDVLAQKPLDWSRVEVTLSDERWVGPADPASNEHLVRERLLHGPAAAARLVPLKTASPDPESAIAEVEAALAAMRRPFDVALLGMGADGHVASLFPGAPELAQALDDAAGRRACAVRREGAAGAAARLSLTRLALLDARRIVVLIEGEEKLAVYRRAASGDDLAAMPIRMVLQQNRAPAQVWWAP
jgi:6-phosphogluconolactonase